MSDKTAIEWTDATWNPIRGCRRVSEGCTNCYAERVASRFCGKGQPYEGLARRTPAGPRWTGDVMFLARTLDQPARWTRPRRVFVNSMSDLFYERLHYPHIEAVFGAMAAAPQHQFQVLTKRPQSMLSWFCWFDGSIDRDRQFVVPQLITRAANLAVFAAPAVGDRLFDEANKAAGRGDWPLPNVWLGVSVENQDAADARIPALMQTPAAIRWLSVEPLIGPVNLLEHLARGGIDWVVVGGESGPGARPMDPSWARAIRDQCADHGVPFLFKQWGEWAPVGGRSLRIGKKAAGRELDGVIHDAYPVAIGGAS